MPKPPRDLTVSEEQDYLEDGHGPPEDTDVFSKDGSAPEPERPAHMASPKANQPASKPDDPLRDLRRTAARHARGSALPSWMGLAVGLLTAGVVAFALVLIGGAVIASLLGGASPIGSAPSATAGAPDSRRSVEAPPTAPDQIQGVEVRRGLKGGGDEALPPKRVEPE